MTLCNGHPQHEMLQVVPGLDLCECSASGWLTYLKGVVADARAIDDRAGGFDAVRSRIRAKAVEQARLRRDAREDNLKAWHSAGTYR